MKLIIDIPKKIYENAKEDMLCGSEALVHAIKTGVPLKSKWISVREKLPNIKGRQRYLVTKARPSGTDYVDVCEFDARGAVPYWNGYHPGDTAKVVAWTPLPETYRSRKKK